MCGVVSGVCGMCLCMYGCVCVCLVWCVSVYVWCGVSVGVFLCVYGRVWVCVGDTEEVDEYLEVGGSKDKEKVEEYKGK